MPCVNALCKKRSYIRQRYVSFPTAWRPSHLLARAHEGGDLGQPLEGALG